MSPGMCRIYSCSPSNRLVKLSHVVLSCNFIIPNEFSMDSTWLYLPCNRVKLGGHILTQLSLIFKEHGGNIECFNSNSCCTVGPFSEGGMKAFDSNVWVLEDIGSCDCRLAATSIINVASKCQASPCSQSEEIKLHVSVFLLNG